MLRECSLFMNNKHKRNPKRDKSKRGTGTRTEQDSQGREYQVYYDPPKSHNRYPKTIL